MANNNHFELCLDTLAPSGSISRGETLAHNDNFALTIDKGDATFMRIWFDTTATPSAIPGSGVELIPAATSYTTKFSTDGTYYYHVVLEDDLGNQSAILSTEAIQYDITLPVVSLVEITDRAGVSKEVLTTRDAGVHAIFSDNLSGCVSYRITGEIVGSIVDGSADYAVGTAYAKDTLIKYNSVGYSVYEAITAEENTSFDAIKAKLIFWATISGTLTQEEITAGSIQKAITLSGSGEEESTKTIYVTVLDAAGNIASPVSDTVYLDTKFLVGAIVLRDKDDTKTIIDTWVNVADFGIALTASDKSDWKGYKVWGDFNADGGATGTTEPENFTDLTEAEVAAKRVFLVRKFTSGDAENKTVNAKIIDENGNVTTLKAVSADVDYTAPTVSIACNKTYVSLQTGFNEAVFTPNCDATISGAYGYKWYCNGTEWAQAKGGSGLGDPVALTVAAADLGDGGEKVAKVFTLTVTDNAGNSTTSVGVTLYLDTVAPSGNITMNAWYNRDDANHDTYSAFSAAGATASATDGGAGMAYMTCWCSQIAQDTTVTGTQVAYAENPTHAQINWKDKAESQTNYIHIEYVDAVGNKSIAHSAAFGIDLTVPTDGTVTFTKEAYPTTAATVLLSSSDTLSGVDKFKIWGSAVDGVADEASATWESFASSKALTMTIGDGTKTANVKYMDVAGNMSVTAVSDTTELDTSTPSVETWLKVSGSEEAKPAISNVKESDFRFEPTDDNLGKIFYHVYGDFTTDGTQAAQGLVEKSCSLYTEGIAYNANVLVLHEGAIYMTATAINAGENTDWATFVTKSGATANTDYWKEFIPDTGNTYKTIATVCTSGDGTKLFNVKIMDNAGNQVAGTQRSFVYDTTAPGVVVSDVDYNRISKVHTSRLTTSEGTVIPVSPEKFNDETKFTFTPDSDCQAYKVVAYVSQAAAKAGSAADDPIKQTGDAKAKDTDPTPASTNMHASGIEFGPSYETKAINSTIKGADYETRLLVSYDSNAMTQAEAEALGFTFEDGEVNGIDGAHYVVVYVQDLGGTWSQNAIFEI